MITIEKYEIDKQILDKAPPYYRFMIYNKMMKKSHDDRLYFFSSKYNGNAILGMPKKLLSQIIDYKLLEIDFQNANTSK